MSFFNSGPPVKKDKTQETLQDVRVTIRTCKRTLQRQMGQYEQLLQQNKDELDQLSKDGDRAGALMSLKTMKKTQRLIDGIKLEIKTADLLLLDAQQSNMSQRVADMQKKVNKAYVAMDKSISVTSIRTTAQNLEKNREKLAQKNAMVAEASESLRDSIMADDNGGGDGDDEDLEEEYEEYLEMQASQQMMASVGPSADKKEKDSLSAVLDDLFGPLQPAVPSVPAGTDGNNNNNNKQ